MKISVVVNTKNEEKYIEQCLSSVLWADEIIVVDMQSQDATVSLAKKYTNLIYYCEDFGYVEPARNQSISYATGDWVFILDADEIIPNNLSLNVRDLILKNETYSLLAIPRKNYIGNHLIKNSGWGLDYQPRLFKKNKVVWKEIIHSWPDVDGEILYLDPNDDLYIIHHNYIDIYDFVNRLNKYTNIEANNIDNLSFTWQDILKYTFKEFKLRYTPQEDGIHSLALAGSMAFYRFISYCKALEKSDQNGKECNFLLPNDIKTIITNFTEIELSGFQELERSYREWQETQILLQQAQTEWQEAQNIIQAMESSKFWKIRQFWFKLKEIFRIGH